MFRVHWVKPYAREWSWDPRCSRCFRSDHFADLSANQWLGLTPAAVVAATLNLDRDTVAAMRNDKPLIIMP